ncbi:hypothetical protein [Sphingomonas sp.]|jgi:hypothetical protein|uniref:hypothetical protein n=1 Tax=Sphingomonas sp. TaxID=28214 RepID=UPI002E1171D4|nr:hypothetical protein [Sphingomonas sp.]
MTFYVYRRGSGFELSNGIDTTMPVADEAAAIDAAVRIAQDNDVLYTINYWRP